MRGVSHVFWSTKKKYYWSVYHLNRNIFDVFSAQNAVQCVCECRQVVTEEETAEDTTPAAAGVGWGVPAGPRGAASWDLGLSALITSLWQRRVTTHRAGIRGAAGRGVVRHPNRLPAAAPSASRKTEERGELGHHVTSD